MLAQPRKLTLLLVAMLALFAFAAACGEDDDGANGDPTPAATATAAATAAATGDAGNGEIDISGIDELSDGTLDIGSDIAYAPIEFLDETTNEPAGLDVDIANAMAEVLGVEAVFENGVFDGLLPALASERHDVVMSAMFVNDERKQQVDFVEYFQAGSGFIVAAGNPEGILTVEDLCGKTVAVQEGTTHIESLEAIECPDGAITLLRFATDPEAVQALVAGQAQAEVADYPVAAYSAQLSGGDLEVLDIQIDPSIYGIAVRKDSTALRDALQAAYDQIAEDGTLDAILEKWDLASGKLD